MFRINIHEQNQLQCFIFRLDHGGLAFTSSFCFESAIRYIKTKAHGTRHLASQIAYWLDINSMIPQKEFCLPFPALINEVPLEIPLFDPYRNSFVDKLKSLMNNDMKLIKLFLRFKDTFSTYHSFLYDKRFNCASYVISFHDDNGKVEYGHAIIFYSLENLFYVFIQKYKLAQLKLSDRLDIPDEFKTTIDSFYPLCYLSDELVVIKTADMIGKCVSIPFEQYQCITDRRVSFEHD